MKHIRLAAVIPFLLLLIIITACGGGGGTGTSSTSTTSTTGLVGPFSGIRVEGLLNGSSMVDPNNIFVNETVQFRITGIDEGQLSQPRVVLPSSGWNLSGSAGGSLTSAGLYTAPATASPSSGSVLVTFQGSTYGAAILVKNPQAILKGKARLRSGVPTQTNLALNTNVTIQALDSSGTVLASGRPAPDGTIRIGLPTTSVKFTFALSSNYAKQFAYNGLDYSTLIAGCTAPLPTLTAGNTSNLLTDAVLYANNEGTPPPPPDGCH